MNIGLSNPFNYTGSKHRYLRDLMEILPDLHSLSVCDPFVGGGDLCTNLPISWNVSASDAMPQLIEMHKEIAKGFIDVDLVCVRAYQSRLNNKDEQSYYKFRDSYNASPSPLDLYLLICHANSNRLRFSSNGFNVPFGKRWFNLDIQAKLADYHKRLWHRDIAFEHRAYSDVCFDLFDLTLIDPPYLNTTATYNEKGGWGVDDEIHLHAKIKAECKKFVYFGQIWSKGIHNKILDDFSKDYNIKILKDTTKHCSANRNDDKTIEVMIWNY